MMSQATVLTKESRILFRERHAPKNLRRQGIRRGVPRALATS